MEIITLAIFALLIFGPQKLPEIARTAGRVLREVRSATNELSEELKAGFEETPSKGTSPSAADHERGNGKANGFPRPGPR